MVNIFQFVTQLEAGGAQRVAVLLKNGFMSQGHQSAVAFLFKKRDAFVSESQIRTFSVRPKGVLTCVDIVTGLLGVFLRERPDVVIAHTHYSNIICCFLARLCGIRHRIAVQHNPVSTYPRAARILDLFLGSTGFYTANVCVSQAVFQSTRIYPSTYQKHLRVIYNGIECPQVPTDHAKVLKRYGIPTGVRFVINVGRLAYQKNQATILDAILPIPDLHLVLAGDGELRGELENKAERMGLADRVHFLGEIDNLDVRQLIAAADVYVFPSRFEGMSLALMEVLCIGKPIVASNIAPNLELLGDAAFFIAPEDSQGLTQYIRTLLDSPSQREGLIAKAKIRAATFNLQAMIANYESIFSGTRG